MERADAPVLQSRFGTGSRLSSARPPLVGMNAPVTHLDLETRPSAETLPTADGVAAAPRLAGEADRALVARLLAGDAASFEELVASLHGRALRFAEAFLQDRGLAEDALQETWLAVISNLSRWEGRAALKTWVYTILINQARKAARRRERELPLSTLGAPEAEDESSRLPEGRAPWATAPESDAAERNLDRKARLIALERAVDRLPAMQRAVLILSDIEELPAEDVCNVLGLSRVNRRVILHRARSRVRVLLDGRGSNPARRDAGR